MIFDPATEGVWQCYGDHGMKVTRRGFLGSLAVSAIGLLLPSVTRGLPRLVGKCEIDWLQAFQLRGNRGEPDGPMRCWARYRVNGGDWVKSFLEVVPGKVLKHRAYLFSNAWVEFGSR